MRKNRTIPYTRGMPPIVPPMTMPSRPQVVRDPIRAPGLGLSGQNVCATNMFVELTTMKS